MEEEIRTTEEKRHVKTLKKPFVRITFEPLSKFFNQLQQEVPL